MITGVKSLDTLTKEQGLSAVRAFAIKHGLSPKELCDALAERQAAEEVGDPDGIVQSLDRINNLLKVGAN